MRGPGDLPHDHVGDRHSLDVVDQLAELRTGPGGPGRGLDELLDLAHLDLVVLKLAADVVHLVLVGILLGRPADIDGRIKADFGCHLASFAYHHANI